MTIGNWSPVGFEEDWPIEATPFRSSEDVRHWRVLHALATHPAGDYKARDGEVAAAFERVLAGIRSSRISLDYQRSNDIWFDVPPLRHPLHAQGMLYWCAKLGCHLDVLYEAHSVCGSHSLIKDLERAVAQIQRRSSVAGWTRTLDLPTLTPPTVPFQLPTAPAPL